MNNLKLKKYIKNFLQYELKHDKDYYTLVKNKYSTAISDKIYQLIIELSIFGEITKKNLYALCQCILYGIINNNIIFISMNSNALIENQTTLRKKPQYKKINFINLQLQKISNKLNIPISYISILPDYIDKFPINQYDAVWDSNIEYLEKESRTKAYRLSNLCKIKNFNLIKKDIFNNIDKNHLQKIINYYQNNQFIVIGFSAEENFQKKQIINYTVVGIILERIFSFCILLDVQKKYYPFEQKFYNYARKNKIPIILCGQTIK